MLRCGQSDQPLCEARLQLIKQAASDFLLHCLLFSGSARGHVQCAARCVACDGGGSRDCERSADTGGVDAGQHYGKLNEQTSFAESSLPLRCDSHATCLCFYFTGSQKLMTAKWRHMMTLARGAQLHRANEYRAVQRSWRDLATLHYCVVLSSRLLHGGISAAEWALSRLEGMGSWVSMLHSVEDGPDAPPFSRYQQLYSVRRLLRQAYQRMLDGVVWDSPKLPALLKLLREKRWLRRWQASRRAAEQSLQAASAEPSDVTVIAVYNPLLLHVLHAFIERYVPCSMVEASNGNGNGHKPGQSEPQNLLVAQRCSHTDSTRLIRHALTSRLALDLCTASS